VVAFNPVYGPGAQPHNQADHARFRVHGAVPGKGVSGHANARGIGQVIAAMETAIYPLDQQGHGFLALIQASLFTVHQSVVTHGRGVDLADGIFQLRQSLFRCPLVDQEDTVVFAGKGVAETILLQAG